MRHRKCAILKLIAEEKTFTLKRANSQKLPGPIYWVLKRGLRESGARCVTSHVITVIKMVK